MPPTSGKNLALSQSGMDLGLGDMVKQQLEDQEEERKKKLLRMANPQFGPASMSLLGGSLGFGPNG